MMMTTGTIDTTVNSITTTEFEESSDIIEKDDLEYLVQIPIDLL